jgi:LacI family transcriptional regulator
MKRKDKRICRVLVSAWIARAGGRDTLTGIFRFLASNPNWQLSIVQSDEEFTPDIVRTAKDKGFDGIIATIPGSQETLDALACTPLPLVIKNIRSSAFKKRRSPTAFIYNDNTAIGRLAATTLLNNGQYASYAYVPEFDENWCRERGKSFCAKIDESGRHCAVFHSATSPAKPVNDHKGLTAFIASLPKPVAVYAATDLCAVKVLAAANEAKVSVPSQMALLGTDNDEFLTQYTSPPISSIKLGHVKMGYMAAKTLATFMRRRRAQTRQVQIHIPPVSVVERASTKPVPPATTLVARTKAYIADHACERIDVMDVVGHLGVSRSLIEKRFRQMEGTSLRRAIEESRLAEARRLLEKTALPVKEIASRCGFSGQNRLSHVFKARFGLAPEHWRLARSPQVP